MLGDRTVTVIAIVVTAIWAGLNVLDALSTAYSMPTGIHGIMGLVAGGAFGERYVRRRTSRTDEDVKELMR